MFFILLAILFGIYFYWDIIRPLSFWKKKGIPYVKGYPIVGNYIWSILQRKSFAESILCYYNALPEEKCVGIFAFNKPQLMIRDLDLIKQMIIKDFDYFTDHTKSFFAEGFDSLFDKNLFSLSGQSWRDMRATLSPAFTGSKMRGMFNMINECGEQVANYYLNELNKSKGVSHLEIELKDSFTRFTNDVIASTAFGVKCDSFKDKTNQFYLMGRDASTFATWRILLINFIPTIMRILKIGVLPIHVCNYFRNLVKETTTIRARENIIRPDMLQILMQAQKGALKHDDHSEENKGFAVATESNVQGKIKKLDDDDVAAQAFIFFIAGFETVSTAMCFTAYELALNPDTQSRVFDEIQHTLNSNNGKLSYDGLNKMKYLDMVISESLRKWPPAVLTDRVCTKPYTLNVNGKNVVLDKGTALTIPVYGIHHDPNYYSSPEKFDPERFSDENKHTIDPIMYLPFGVGPRVCIGSRFALMEMKIVLLHLIKNFEIIVTKKSTVPPKLSPKASNMTIIGGFNVGLKPRTV